MKNQSICGRAFFLVTICFLLVTCSYAGNDKLPDPKIQSGIAKVTGQVIDYHPNKGDKEPTITLTCTKPVTAELVEIETALKDDGSFHFEVPVECNITVGYIYSSFFNNKVLFVGLTPGQVAKIEIAFDKTGKIKPKISSSLELTPDDTQKFSKLYGNFVDSRDYDVFYMMSPEEFGHLATDKLLVNRLNRSINDSILSKKGRNFISNECKLFYLSSYLLYYSGYMARNYQMFKAKDDPDNFTPKVPKRSYFAFLKSFNLNDPQLLYNESYPKVFKPILLDETLNIPRINDMPINDWLKKVKVIMADLIGADSGLFYDMLTANSYLMQFDNKFIPFSDKQIANIKGYFKNKEFTKILLEKNEVINKMVKELKKFKIVVNKTPTVSKEELMKAIVSKYQGKVVVVDFWATWCGPCKSAMKESVQVKSEMYGKDVVFVYLTDASSPKKLWEEDIQVIGCEQYYLTLDEMNYLKKSFDFTGIPTYLLYGKNGELKNKLSGYPGNANMQKMLETLLQ